MFTTSVVHLIIISVISVIVVVTISSAKEDYLTVRPVARKGYGPVAHEAKPNGLLTRDP